MSDLQPGDAVEFEVQLFECSSCKTESPFLYPESHFMHVTNGVPQGVICSTCADTPEKRVIPNGMIKAIIEGEPLDEPLVGNFHPAVQATIQESGMIGDFWVDLGHSILETMAVWQGKVLKFSLGGNRYKGLWIKPHWLGTRVSGFSLAGDTPSKNLELDIYQLSRLRKMGFIEEGRTNRIWEIALTAEEGTITNSSGIILHILKYGYLLEPTDLSTVTPTLDIDLDDPEYRDLKSS